MTKKFMKHNRETFLGASRQSVKKARSGSCRSKTAEDLPAEKNRADQYLDIADTLILVLNRTGKVDIINKKGCEILGYDKKDIIGKNWFDNFLPRRTRVEVKKAFDNLTKGIIKKVEYFENPVLTKKGEERMVRFHNVIMKDKKGHFDGVLSAGEDITEQKAIEADLRRAKKLYTSLVENSSDGIAILQDGVVKFFNKKMYEMVGYTPPEALGKPFVQFITDKYKKTILSAHLARSKGKQADTRYQIEIAHKDGTFFPVEINASYVDYEGKPASLAFIRDITRAQEIDRMKTEFVSVASHQLRTPLTGIKWFSELLLKGRVGVLSKDQLDFLQQIYESNTRMINLVDDLLDVSHIEMGEKYNIVFRKANLSGIIRNVLNEQKMVADKKGIKLKVVGKCPHGVTLNVDKVKVAQVFENVFSNAIKYSASGSVIFLRCHLGKNHILYSIKDQGIGIPRAQQHRLFEKFFRGDNVISIEPGTGLGLYIAKFIMEKHGGKIWLESEINKGTTVYLSFPVK